MRYGGAPEMIGNELNTAAVSLEEWVAKVGTWKTATRELVRLWLINELGCQRELANHLGLSDRAIRKHVAKLREDGELPQVAETDGRAKGQKKELGSYSVEQFAAPAPVAAYPSAVVPPSEHDEEPPPLPTAEELMARVLNLEAENASLRALLEAQPAQEQDVSGSNVLAQHYVQAQENGSCDSYKQAEYHLSCFLELLGRSLRDGWTEREFYNLHQDLSGPAKLCANASGSLRVLLEAQPAVEATESVELTEALAKVKELEAKVDSLFKENEELCDELAEQDEEVERLEEVVTAKNVWIEKREQMLIDQHGSTPMEKRWKALLHRVDNKYPAPIPSTRTIRDAPAIMDAIAKESTEKGFAKSGDETLTTERYVRGQALIKWWNTQTQLDGEGKRTGWVHFSGDDTLELLTLLDDFWPVEAATTAAQTIDA